jgi:hypothetical protein
VGTCHHKFHRRAREPSEKVFVLEVLYILSLFSVSNISMSGVMLSRGKVGEILISYMKANAVFQNTEDAIDLYKKKFNISCDRTRSTAHNIVFYFAIVFCCLTPR